MDSGQPSRQPIADGAAGQLRAAVETLRDGETRGGGKRQPGEANSPQGPKPQPDMTVAPAPRTPVGIQSKGAAVQGHRER